MGAFLPAKYDIDVVNVRAPMPGRVTLAPSRWRTGKRCGAWLREGSCSIRRNRGPREIERIFAAKFFVTFFVTTLRTSFEQRTFATRKSLSGFHFPIRQAGFEPTTSASGGQRSIQLSYWRTS